MIDKPDNEFVFNGNAGFPRLSVLGQFMKPHSKPTPDVCMAVRTIDGAADARCRNAILKNIRVFGNPADLNARTDFGEPRISQRINRRRNQTMTRFKTLGAAAVLSMMIATPLFAQAAIGEPGAFAFYHPDADVLNAGRPTPAASGAVAPVPFGGSDAYASMGGNASGSSCAQRYRSYDPASGTFLGHDGYRHPCE